MDLHETHTDEEREAAIQRGMELINADPKVCSATPDQVAAEHAEMKGVVIPVLIGLLIGRRLK